MAGVRVDKAHGIARIVFDNPPINLFTVEEFAATARIIAELSVDDEVSVVILSSANPDFFIAHFDVEAILTFPTDQPPATSLNAYHVMCEQLRTMPKATIAVIEGRVGGGGSELSLRRRIRVQFSISPKSVSESFREEAGPSDYRGSSVDHGRSRRFSGVTTSTPNSPNSGGGSIGPFPVRSCGRTSNGWRVASRRIRLTRWPRPKHRC